MSWDFQSDRDLSVTLKRLKSTRRNQGSLLDERVRRQVRDAMTGLDYRSRTAIRDLFGIDTDEPRQPSEVAGSLKMTEPALDALCADALRALRTAPAERVYDC